jgi:DNA recombination protein RmuC
MILLSIASAVILLCFCVLAFLFFSQFTKGMTQMQKTVDDKLNWMTREVDGRLRDNSQSLQNASVELGSKLESAVKAVTDVHQHLGKLEESHKRIYELGKDITGLQNLLRAPKIRGGIGEFFLTDLLKQMLPEGYFAFQYEFKSRERVDAVIKFGQGLAPIDAKFPLENFRKFAASEDDKERAALRRQFVSDIKNHIKSISEKYIKPDEGTFDFALMYIPAENVYYEAIIKDGNLNDESSLFQYSLARKVIPVSPNSFYAYLRVILLGLKGMAIEKGAQKIIQNISRLRTELNKFYDDFSKVGKHLGNSKSSYDEAEKHLIKFNDRLTQLDTPAQTQKIAQ